MAVTLTVLKPALIGLGATLICTALAVTTRDSHAVGTSRLIDPLIGFGGRGIPAGDPVVVLLNTGDGELLTWDQFERRGTRSPSTLPHTRYYLDGQAVDHLGDGRRVVRSTWHGEGQWLSFVMDELDIPEDLSISIDPAISSLPLSQRLDRARRATVGPFDPRAQRWIEEFGTPYLVIEEFWGVPVLESEARERREEDRRLSAHGWETTWDMAETVVHPSWEDYVMAYTPQAGEPTFRPVRRVTSASVVWIYNERLKVFNATTSLGISPSSANHTIERRLADLEGPWNDAPEGDDLERYRRIQQELRPSSRLGDAVLALLESQETEPTGDERQP